MSDTAHQIPTRRKLAYTGLLVLILLVGAEGALRLRQYFRYGTFSTTVLDPMIMTDPESGLLVPRPGFGGGGGGGGGIDIRINSLGFRGDELSRVKPKGTVRIAVLGASTTFCAESSSNHTTWPHRLQEKLQAVYPNVHIEVINAAFSGYVADDNLKNLQHRVLPLDPDLVIYYEANNEIVQDTRGLAEREELRAAGGAPLLVRALSRASLIVNLLHTHLAIATRIFAPGRLIDRIPRDLPAHFIGVLDRMRQDLADRHIRFMVSTFLVKYRRSQDRATQIKNADVAFFYMPWMSIEGMLDAMDTYNAAILEFAAQHQLPVVDDREAIPPDAAHYADCMHFNDRGSEAMADRFARYLTQSGIAAELAATAERRAEVPATGAREQSEALGLP